MVSRRPLKPVLGGVRIVAHSIKITLMNRLKKPSLLSIFPDYQEVATAVVVPCEVGKTHPVHRCSVVIFAYSGPTVILSSDEKQNTAY